MELLYAPSGQVRSGQVRVFNVHIQNKLLYSMPVMVTGPGLRQFLCPGGNKGGRDWNWLQVEGGLMCYGIWNVP